MLEGGKYPRLWQLTAYSKNGYKYDSDEDEKHRPMMDTLDELDEE